MEIVGFIPQSFCDWPGRAAAVIFTPGCNFRCRYCHNSNLVLHPEKLRRIDEREVLERLKRNRWAVDAVVITGGEPTLHFQSPTASEKNVDLREFCSQLKRLGFVVKLDTNGSRPAVLRDLFQSPAASEKDFQSHAASEKKLHKGLLDYVAMDLKAPLAKYPEVAGAGADGVEESIRLIIKSGVDHEFRMTYAPALLSPEDVAAAAALIRGARRFTLQQFQPKECLDPQMLNTARPSYEELEKIANSLDFDGEIRIRSDAGETVCRHPRAAK